MTSTTATPRVYNCPDWCEVSQEQHRAQTLYHVAMMRQTLTILGSDSAAAAMLEDERELTCHRKTLDGEADRWFVGFDAYDNGDGTVDPAGPNIYIQEDSTLTCDEMDRIAAAIAELSRRLRALT